MVLTSWGSEWMWEHSQLIGPHTWIAMALQNNMLLLDADQPYMRQLAPNMCAAAFILEFKMGTRRFRGVMAGSRMTSNAYQGELLGLLAINLIIWSICNTMSHIQGRADVYCDCLGAINCIKHLPLYCIPSRTKHADILILLLTLSIPTSIEITYHHIVAHQDDSLAMELLPQPVQLNCQFKQTAKTHLLQHLENPTNQTLPRECIILLINASYY